MNDEFLIRVDEELPSDERIAVKLVETKVLGEEYRIKLETLLDKIDSLAAINNTEILREMKDILSGMLDSITAINNKYGFISEMVLKIDEKTKYTELIGMNEKIDKMSRGMADILANIQTSVSELSASVEKVNESSPLISDSILKIDDRTNELSVSNAELNQKLSAMSADTEEAMGRVREKIGELSVINAENSGKLETISSSSEELSDKVGGLSVGLAELNEKVSNIDLSLAEEKLSELSTATASLIAEFDNKFSHLSRIEEKISELSVSGAETGERLSNLEGIGSSIDSVSEAVRKMDEKLSDISLGTLDAIDKMDRKLDAVSELKAGVKNMEEKLDSVSIANSELLGNIYDSLRNAESRYDAVSDVLLRLDDKLGETSLRNAEALEKIADKINEKLSDIHTNDSEMMNKLGEMSLGSSEAISSIRASITSVEDKYSDVKKAASLVRSLTRSQNTLNRTIEDLNAYLINLNNIDFMVRLIKARTSLKRRLPSWARQRRSAIEKMVANIEDEITDLLIINAVKKEGITITELSRTIGKTRKKTVERIARLMAEGRIELRKVGRKRLYFLLKFSGI